MSNTNDIKVHWLPEVFVQIAIGHDDYLYALDRAGYVWFTPGVTSPWKKANMERDED
jgi:hypothetical protein